MHCSLSRVNSFIIKDWDFEDDIIGNSSVFRFDVKNILTLLRISIKKEKISEKDIK